MTTTDPCRCPPGFYVLSCDQHWERVGAARVLNVTPASWPPRKPAAPTPKGEQ